MDKKQLMFNEMEREKLLQRQLNIQDKLSAIFSKIGTKIGEVLLPDYIICK